MNNLSLCMIVRNEVDRIFKCLDSVDGLIKPKNIHIVDHHSTDGTYSALLNRGYTPIQEFWKHDFSHARNISLQMAQTDWILILDADEWLPDESKVLIEALLANPPEGDYPCFQLKIVNHLDEGEQVTEHFMTRLIPNSEKLRFQGAIHEQLVGTGVEIQNYEVHNIAINHSGYKKEVMEAKNKLTRNLEILEHIENPTPFDLYNLANTYMAAERKELAVNFFIRAIEEAKSSGEKQNWLDHAYSTAFGLMVELNQLEEAADFAVLAPDSIVNRPDYWVHLGDLRYKTGDYDIAIGAYDRAVSMRHNATCVVHDHKHTTWRPLAGIGNVYLALENPIYALNYYKKALIFNPEYKPLQDAVKHASKYRW